MRSEQALAFLGRHGMDPREIVPSRDAAAMAEEMELGLQGHGGSMGMIPTYLSDSGQIPLGEPVAVIDAGGTNFRRALLAFDENGYRVEQLDKWLMPGLHEPVTWEEFIHFTADRIEPLMDRTDKIGFCFSYTAEVTPEIDGRVVRIDKEVEIRGCEGQLVGASLTAELERRGFHNKRVVILNDTVAVLLGGIAQSRQGGHVIGQVSGTGTNTCCALPESRIGKLGRTGDRRMIVNLESGMYRGLPTGDFDQELDRHSHNPGEKHLEKLTAGVYLGELCHMTLKAAGAEGLLRPACTKSLEELGWIDSAVIDAWAMGEQLDRICAEGEDAAFVQTVCEAMFARSARAMCTNLGAILLLTGDREATVFAEGSLVQKGRVYQPLLERLIHEEIGACMGRQLHLCIGQESTLPGSAAAALLNL